VSAVKGKQQFTILEVLFVSKHLWW